MSGYKGHGKSGRDRDGDSDKDRDSRHHHHHHHSRDRGESRGREGSRDGRDRDHRSKHSDSRDNRPGLSSQGTPTKPPVVGAAVGAAAAAGAGGAKPPAAVTRPVLGSSFMSSSLLEAAKRRAAEAAAAAGDTADDDAEPGEVAAAPSRKKPKHEPIVWHSPSTQSQGADARSASQQETLQERLQREAAEFRQQQHGDTRAGSRQARPTSRAGRSPSSSPGSSRSRGRGGSGSRSPAADAGRDASRHRSRHRRGRSSSSERSSRSRSGDSPREGGGRRRKGGAAAGARWQQDEDDEQQEQQKEKQPAKSRWAVDDDAADQEVEEGEAVGEAVGAAIDEELEELNRQERAALAADSDEEGGEGGGGSDEAEQMRHEGLDLHHDMLQESRGVEEYERLNRISEGTYGVVYRARCKSSGKIYALKKLKMEHCPDGFPQTSVREINVMLSLHHPNIANVSEVVVQGTNGIFMVMEYVEHDLKYILELQKAKKAQQFSIGQIKCLMQQLLEGIAFLHHKWVIHRDLKTSNLLYGNTGELKICDFGLARQYGDPLSPYTPMVVTLWYRSIERLLGDPAYKTALDMWSVGCIMAELLLGEPLFQGKGELDQMNKIFKLLGTPTQESWPGWDQFKETKHLQWKPEENKLRSKFPTVFFGGSAPVLSDAGFDLLSQMLEMNPANRISAEDALKHKWFQEAPRPVTPALMPSFTPRHQTGGSENARDKLLKPSPGAVGPAGFKLK